MSVTATIKSGDTIWGLVKAKNPGATDAEIQKKTQAVLDANGLTWESAKKMHAGDTVKLDAGLPAGAAPAPAPAAPAPAPAATPANTAQGAEKPLDDAEFLKLLQQYFAQQQENQPANADPFSIFNTPAQGQNGGLFGAPGQVNFGINDPLGILGGFGGNAQVNRAAGLATIDPFAARNLVIGLLG